MDINADDNVLVADGGDLTDAAYDRNGALVVTPDGEILERWVSYGSHEVQFLLLAVRCVRSAVCASGFIPGS